MKLGGADLCVFAVYILLVLAVGLYGARRTQATKRDYFLAGDKLPWWMVGTSIAMSSMGGFRLVVFGGIGLAYGFEVVDAEVAAILFGLAALLWILLPHFLRTGIHTTPEFLERRFGKLARTVFAGLLVIVYVFGEISLTLAVAASVLHMLLGLNPWLTIVVIGGLTGVYTVLGGLRSVVWTQVLQLLVVVAGAVLLVLSAKLEPGEWSAVFPGFGGWVRETLLSGEQGHLRKWLGGVLSLVIFYYVANQAVVQKVLAARNEWHARMGVVFAGYVKLLLMLVLIVPSIVVGERYFHADMALLVAASPLSAGAVGLVLAGLAAAAMARVSSTINSCAMIATIDLYLPFLNRSADDKETVQFGKRIGTAILVLAVPYAGYVAISHRSLLDLFAVYAYVAPGIAVVFLFGCLWKRATSAGALAAGALTIPLSLALGFGMPRMGPMAAASLVFWACSAAMIVVSLVTKPKPEREIEALIWRPSSLTVLGMQPHLIRGCKSPVVWWAVLTAILLLVLIWSGVMQ